MPRETRSTESEGWLRTVIKDIIQTFSEWTKGVFEWIEEILRAIRDWFRRDQAGHHPHTGFRGWHPLLQVTLYTLVAVLVCFIVVLLIRMLKKDRTLQPLTESEPADKPPDLSDDLVKADELPESGWMSLAREMLDKGDLRLAMRAIYLAGLAFLAQNELITIAKYKSDRDYKQELKRRFHSKMKVNHLFAENVSVFERVWYGMHAITREMVDNFSLNQERIKNFVEE